MISLRTMAAAIAALGVTMGAPADAAENLDCIDKGYTAEQQAVLDAYIGRFNMESWSKNGVPSEVLTVIVDRVRACASMHGWSAEAAQHALLFKLARIGVAGVETTGPLSPAQILQVRNAMTAEDKIKVRAIFGAMVKAYGEGTLERSPRETPDMFIGKLILRSGIPTTTKNVRAAGGWLAASVLVEQYAEFFAAD